MANPSSHHHPPRSISFTAATLEGGRQRVWGSREKTEVLFFLEREDKKIQINYINYYMYEYIIQNTYSLFNWLEASISNAGL